MTHLKPLKKSETIEVRLPHATKTAFMARCRDEGRTVSEAMRAFMECEIGGNGRSARTRGWHALAALVAGLALGAVAVPSLAQSQPASRAAFDRLDRNQDGVVSFDEFRR
ncbi:EF-hand domain-containing protein [uncultured Brevundimonas sp.]|uniref:EF-hand domain-containing protein n=1 Tax=uncultured Brevundimonas sp. TaxID=213418 RepID=UPI0030EB7AD4|tara:strand:- start:980 stop:1309 length:330 start_codon:yes stop_codon:yes gene_type:complete